ncbi:sel1 repeat family protein [Bradyrhizobium tropiciagri]|uniref:tetratricopeptide repeat protein n=1 Tax=Bradyrhizobium tropiciagri TaxID=312253 RepID=UPI001BA4408F|nr:sel1 repeat family protein [Bradyrhizobium tropiciagri]
MRLIYLSVGLLIGFSGSSACAAEKPVVELLAACDRAAAHPFDSTRPAGVAGVSFEKIVAEVAIDACERAAKAAPNDPRIALQLGRAYQAAKNVDAARRQYAKAFEGGSVQGAASLASLYLIGESGIPKDDAEALRLSKFAADHGNAQGQNDLGVLYLGGHGGLPQNDSEAARLFRLSADQGFASAQYNLGRLYQTGRGGLAKDDYAAARLYRTAAERGNAFAQVYLGIFYLEGRGGVTKDEREAGRLYKLSADQGNALGQVNLGFAYERGSGRASKRRS